MKIQQEWKVHKMGAEKVDAKRKHEAKSLTNLANKSRQT